MRELYKRSGCCRFDNIGNRGVVPFVSTSVRDLLLKISIGLDTKGKALVINVLPWIGGFGCSI